MRLIRPAARTLAVVTAIVAATMSGAQAHEERAAGGYRMTVGWVSEPAYVGWPNAVGLRLVDVAGVPIGDPGGDLTVEVAFGDLSTGPRQMQPVLGSPGAFALPLVPTRPGTYTFRFVGSVRGEGVDQSFTGAHQSVREPTEAQFPVRDASAGQLAARLDRLGPRVEASATRAEADARQARRAGDRATWLAGAAMVVGLVALALPIVRRRRPSPGAEHDAGVPSQAQEPAPGRAEASGWEPRRAGDRTTWLAAVAVLVGIVAVRVSTRRGRRRV